MLIIFLPPKKQITQMLLELRLSLRENNDWMELKSKNVVKSTSSNKASSHPKLSKYLRRPHDWFRKHGHKSEEWKEKRKEVGLFHISLNTKKNWTR